MSAAALPQMVGLVISRHEGERVVIVTPAGERLVIGVARLTKSTVRLAIQAPTSHAIHRAETLDRVEAERARGPIPLVAIGPASTDLLRQHRPTGS